MWLIHRLQTVHNNKKGILLLYKLDLKKVHEIYDFSTIVLRS